MFEPNDPLVLKNGVIISKLVENAKFYCYYRKIMAGNRGKTAKKMAYCFH